MAPTTALVIAEASGANPLIPVAWELSMLLISGAMCAVLVVAVITLVCDRYYTPVQRLLWLLVILIAPVLGATLWLAVGRNRVLDRDDAAAADGAHR
jgi:uncharacterized membrane-anchored protein